MGTTQSDRALNRIIQGLGQKPVYLFFFGICFLAFGGGGVAAAFGSVTKSTSLSTAGVIVVGLALVCSVIVVFLAEREGQGVPAGQTGDADFDPVLEDLYRNIRSALGRAHPVFRGKMLEECGRFQASTALWSQGQLRVSQRDYNQLLLRAYENAAEKVFTTSTIDFLPAWGDRLGSGMLAAHKRGRATVRRVFIFDHLSSIPESAIDEMKKQVLAGIEVKVYGIQEDVGYNFPDDTSMSFAFIDGGDVIALTDPGTGTSFSGTFFFKQKGFTERYKDIAKALDIGSRSFDEFMLERDPTWKPIVPANAASTAK